MKYVSFNSTLTDYVQNEKSIHFDPSLKGDGLIFLHSPFRVRGKNAEKSNVLK